MLPDPVHPEFIEPKQALQYSRHRDKIRGAVLKCFGANLRQILPADADRRYKRLAPSIRDGFQCHSSNPVFDSCSNGLPKGSETESRLRLRKRKFPDFRIAA